MITYRLETKEVVMLNQAVDNENLASAEVEFDERMKQGYRMFFRENAIVYEKPEWMSNQDKKVEMDLQREKLQNAKSISDLKQILETLIN